jgi:hypothetical protein
VDRSRFSAKNLAVAMELMQGAEHPYPLIR